ncbi:MAG: AraC family transcriptional regulator, partial [Clostridia bacterium]|nr:AraC family transcriptional regulator [Clostridia bacterium]
MYPVSEVATRCGFDSISYFSYEFRRRCGETPSEFAHKFEEKQL